MILIYIDVGGCRATSLEKQPGSFQLSVISTSAIKRLDIWNILSASIEVARCKASTEVATKKAIRSFVVTTSRVGDSKCQTNLVAKRQR